MLQLPTRRKFLRAAVLGAGGIFIPNLIVRPLFASTNVIVDNSGDKAVSLANADFNRGFNFGPWSVLRVGLRCSINGTSTLSDGFMEFGIQSGFKGRLAGAPFNNSFGIALSGWVFVNSGTTAYYGNSMQGAPQTHVGSTNTSGGTYVQNYEIPAKSNSSGTSVIIAEFIKGSPNWNINLVMPGWPANNPAAVSRTQFLAAMVASSAIPNGSYIQGSKSMAFSETPGSTTAGVCDHVTVAWLSIQATLEVSDLVVVKYR